MLLLSLAILRPCLRPSFRRSALPAVLSLPRGRSRRSALARHPPGAALDFTSHSCGPAILKEESSPFLWSLISFAVVARVPAVLRRSLGLPSFRPLPRPLLPGFASRILSGLCLSFSSIPRGSRSSFTFFPKSRISEIPFPPLPRWEFAASPGQELPPLPSPDLPPVVSVAPC